MNPPLLQCPKCRGSLLEGCFNLVDLIPCPTCRIPLQVEVFPAFFRKTNPGQGGEAVMVEGESSCFYHPRKKAVIPCAACGRFLCALCDCELNGQHLCPACLETGRTKDKIKNLQNQRTNYDNIALALALYPVAIIPLIYFTFLTAPAALFVAIRYWKTPFSIVRRSKIRYIIAISLAGLEILGWTAFIYFIVNRRKHG